MEPPIIAAIVTAIATIGGIPSFTKAYLVIWDI